MAALYIILSGCNAEDATNTGTREIPFAMDGAEGNAGDLCGFFGGETAEIMKMHEPALTLIKLRQGDEGLVHCDEAYVLAGASASETSVASPPLTSYHFR